MTRRLPGGRKAAALLLSSLFLIAVEAAMIITDDPDEMDAVAYDGGNGQGDAEVYSNYETIGSAHSADSGWVNYYLKHTWTDITMSGNRTALEVKYWIFHSVTEDGDFEEDELFLRMYLHLWEKSGENWVYKGFTTDTITSSITPGTTRTIGMSYDFVNGRVYKVRLEAYGHLVADDGEEAQLYTCLETASQSSCYVKFTP